VRATRDAIPIFRSAFEGPDDEYNENTLGRPVVFDILAPDLETSILPDDLKMVLHVNPTTMSFSYEKIVERIQTKGGYVEQHWGDGTRSISFSMVTGGFKRLYSGLSNITGGGWDAGGTRRETIAYDKYLDMLALFKSNGAIYDTSGQIVFVGLIKVTFDGGIYFGWFSSFTVNEAAEKPYQFDLSAEFTVSHEILRMRSYLTPEPAFEQAAQDTSRYESGVNVIRDMSDVVTVLPREPEVPKEPEEEKATDPTEVKKPPKKKKPRRRRPKNTNAETPPPPEPETPQEEAAAEAAPVVWVKGSKTPGWAKPPSAAEAVAAIQQGFGGTDPDDVDYDIAEDVNDIIAEYETEHDL